MILDLYNETAMMSGLKDQTIALIHCTNEIKPIKILISLHDLINLNMVIEETFKKHLDGPVWDVAALQEMSSLRRSLLVSHRADFKPVKKFDSYNYDLITLFNVYALRHKNARSAALLNACN